MDREQQSTRPGATRATPPKGESKPQVKAAKPKPAQTRSKGAGESPPATSAPDIMSRLPKSRPQRASQRRRAGVAATSKSPPARAAAPSAKKRPASTAGRRASASSASAEAPAAAQARRTADAGSKGAPGLPRLAIDGAAEAVKLPLKVSGRLTLKALDAVARGLRRR